ncbi:MAG: ABC transporter permease [Planctomycetes bacterium]|nr:ABC transporter permease [Planctomycetota bacterium]
MAIVPLSYNFRSLFARAGNTWLTVLSIAATVAVLTGVLSLKAGFEKMFASKGRDDMVILLRPGATSEGESGFDRDRTEIALKEIPEFATDASGKPIASAETYLAALLPRLDGGETNIPLRGVMQETFAVHGDRVQIVKGRKFEPGTDEVIVGRAAHERIRNADVGDVLTLNFTPFRVVGVFDSPGAYATEIWGDVDRIQAALEGRNFSRIIGQLAADADVETLKTRLEHDRRIPAKVQTEREYLENQTGALSGLLMFIGSFLAVIMGVAAVFTGINAMLSAIASRTHEIGILLATGFRPWAVFCAFLLEAAVLGLLGGIAGVLLVLPLNGMQTGTTNFSTFTEVTFAFQTTPSTMLTAVVFAIALGVLGGAWPALRAARMTPTAALRRG